MFAFKSMGGLLKVSSLEWFISLEFRAFKAALSCSCKALMVASLELSVLVGCGF